METMKFQGEVPPGLLNNSPHPRSDIKMRGNCCTLLCTSYYSLFWNLFDHLSSKIIDKMCWKKRYKDISNLILQRHRGQVYLLI